MIYKHQCGQVYLRAATAGEPRSRMVICDCCLEPMPLCDDQRHAYKYKRLQNVVSFANAARRVVATARGDRRALPVSAGFLPQASSNI